MRLTIAKARLSFLVMIVVCIQSQSLKKHFQLIAALAGKGKLTPPAAVKLPPRNWETGKEPKSSTTDTTKCPSEKSYKPSTTKENLTVLKGIKMVKVEKFEPDKRPWPAGIRRIQTFKRYNWSMHYEYYLQVGKDKLVPINDGEYVMTDHTGLQWVGKASE